MKIVSDPVFLVVDLFAGAGGTSQGFVEAELNGNPIVKVIAAINHDPIAIESHWKNHPEVFHFEEDIRTLDLTLLVARVKRQQEKFPNAKLILWASLECVNFSIAKGGQAREADSRTLAYSLIQKWNEPCKKYEPGLSYIQLINPDYVMIENVKEFKAWGPMRIKCKARHEKHSELSIIYDRKTKEPIYGWEPINKKNGEDFVKWCESVKALGYENDWTMMNSANFGARTSRDRLFGIFNKPGLPSLFPEPTHSKKPTGDLFKPLQKWNPVKPCLDFSDEGHSIFNRELNLNLRKQDRKPLKPATMERFFNGCVRHIAGGKSEFLAKIYAVSSTHHGTYHTDQPAHTITTRDAHTIVRSEFLSTYNSGSPWVRNFSPDEPAGPILTCNTFALVQTAFLSKTFSGKPYTKNISVDGPAGTITTVDGHKLIQPVFIPPSEPKPAGEYKLKYLSKYFSGDPYSKSSSIDEPASTIKCKDSQAVVTNVFIDQQANLIQFNNNTDLKSVDDPLPTITNKDKFGMCLIQKYNGNGVFSPVTNPSPTIVASDCLAKCEFSFLTRPFTSGGQTSSINSPAGSIMSIPKLDLIQAYTFLDKCFGNKYNHQSVDRPAGTITTNDHHALMTADPFIVTTNQGHNSSSVDAPCPTILASRRHHILANPAWGGNSGSVDEPAHTIVARQDKAPLSLITCEEGDVVCPIYEGDCEWTIKLKAFMVIYRIKDIKMRMLKVSELLKIQGFPDNYILQGSQSDQKKFIGNSVVPLMPKVWAEAIAIKLLEPLENAA